MVSKGKSTRGSAQAIDYIMSDKENGKAIELDRNLIAGENGNQIISEFREIQELNTRCHMNTYNIILSPSNEREFTNTELREFGREHLKNLELENHQYIMCVHRSTDQPHIHIVCNRIDLNGKAHNDQFISKKCQESAEKIAQNQGLLTAKEVRAIKEQELKPIKQEIQQAHDFSKKRAHNLEEYKEYMYSKGIEVKSTLNKQEELQGLKFYHKSSDLEFKSSEISKKAGIKDLIQNKVKIEIPLSQSYKDISTEISKNSYDRGMSR